MAKKDAYYFPHDANAKDDPKCEALIEKLGLEGYGIYWVLIEKLREQPDFKYPVISLPTLARKYNSDAKKMESVVNDFNLFKVDDDGLFHSVSLNTRMKQYMAEKERRVERARNAGLASANLRSTQVQLESNSSSTIVQLKSTKKREENKREEKKGSIRKPPAFVPPTIEEVIEYFAQRGYRVDVAERAYAHYADNDWKNAHGKNVSNWKSTMNTNWFKPEHKASVRVVMLNPSNGQEITWSESKYNELKDRTEYKFVRYAS